MTAVRVAIRISLSLSRVMSWIMRPYFGSPWTIHIATDKVVAPTSHGISSPLPRGGNSTRRIVTMHSDWQKKKIRGGQLFSMQVSIFPNILVSSNALLNLKMAIITQYTLREMVFSPNLNGFSEIHRKLEWQAKKKGWREKGEVYSCRKKISWKSHTEEVQIDIAKSNDAWGMIGFFLTRIKRHCQTSDLRSE